LDLLCEGGLLASGLFDAFLEFGVLVFEVLRLLEQLFFLLAVNWTLLATERVLLLRTAELLQLLKFFQERLPVAFKQQLFFLHYLLTSLPSSFRFYS